MLTLHILSFGFVLGISAIADTEALAWVLGKKEVLERARMHHYHLMMWFGLIVLVASGLYLFWPMRVYLLGDLLFDAKLLFVGILFVNAVLIGRLMELSFTKSFHALTSGEKRALFVSGAISIFSWFCAASIALLIF